MKKRGKVLRDTSAGAGLLIVDGQQYPFSAKEVWRSETPPMPGMVVEVEFEQYGKIQAIRTLNDPELAAARQSPALSAKQMALSLVSRGNGRFGSMNLLAAGLLLISWTALAAISVQTPLGKLEFTFWQMLGFLNSGNSFEAMSQGRSQAGPGLYGFLALAAMAAPFLRFLSRTKGAALGGLFPLLFMTFIGLMIRSHFENAFSSGAQDALNPVIQQMRDEALAAISPGSGSYVSGLTCLYFAAITVQELVAARTSEKTPKENVRRAAA